MAFARAIVVVVATFLATAPAGEAGWRPGPEHVLASGAKPRARLDVAIGDATALATQAQNSALPMRVHVTQPLMGDLRAGEEIARIGADFFLSGGRCVVFR